MQGTPERRFNTLARVICLTYVSCYVVLCLLFPKYIAIMVVPYAIVLVVGIAYWNRRLNVLRRHDRAKF
jgi:hypothetical protein